MKNILQKVGISIATGTLFLSLLSPMTFANTLSIENNGSDSNNILHFFSIDNTDLSQSNSMAVNNNIDVSADTGGNRVNGNTGGSASVITGNVSDDVSILNQGNINVAAIQACQSMPMDQMMQICMSMDMCMNMSMQDMMAMCQQMGMSMNM